MHLLPAVLLVWTVATGASGGLLLGVIAVQRTARALRAAPAGVAPVRPVRDVAGSTVAAGRGALARSTVSLPRPVALQQSRREPVGAGRR